MGSVNQLFIWSNNRAPGSSEMSAGSGEGSLVDSNQVLHQCGLFIELYLFGQNPIHENF